MTIKLSMINKNLHLEKTLVLVKPDGVKRGLTGEVIKRFEMKGLKLVAVKMVKSTADHIKKHYRSTKEQLEGMGNKTFQSLREHGLDPLKEMGTDNPMVMGKLINGWNVESLTSGPLVAMVFQGLHAVEAARKIAGATMPIKAELGTIRGDFSTDSPLLANANKRAVRNIVHASSSVPDAETEIKHWFSSKELHSYKRAEEDTMFS